MARRLDKTLADYLVIAISPALIMTLIGSLVFFLVQVFYSGQYVARLHYILTLFIFAAVLIGRISIEEGAERAALFAIPLGIATFLAIEKFAQIQGVPLAPLSDVINVGLIGLIWWSAHKLTWDCTMIDEHEPDAGEGVLESAGLDKPPTGRREVQQAREPEGTTSRGPLPGGWWARWVERRRRPHAPGVWVVYFSLAALPLFGVGQLFIPAENLDGRRYAFSLLCVYVASGLGLLLCTSFLGLRRYLRQRRLEMPMLMANTWITLGGALIAVVMGLALLLPRPNAEYAISQPPFTFGTPDQNASPYAVEGSGVEEDQLWSRAAKEDQPSETRSPSPRLRRGADGQSQSQGAEDQAQSQPGKPGDQAKSQPGKSQAPSPSPGLRRGVDGQAQSQSDESAGKDQSRPARDVERPPSGGKKQDQPTPESRESAKDQPRRTERGSAPPAGSTRRDEPRQSTSPPAQPAGRSGSQHATPPPVPRLEISSHLAGLLSLLKWVFYGGVILLAAWWLWRARAELLAALRGLLEGWSALWQALFGWRGKGATATAAEVGLRRPSFRPFVAFTDPFATGIAGRYSADELVRYTFEALEAWARDHGSPRQPEQTPHEFARMIAQRAAPLADDAHRLADLYCQVAYASGRLAVGGTQPLAGLWQKMRAEASSVPAS
jgi:hypothetical protein